MDDFNWSIVNHVDTQFTLNDSWKEALVNELAVFSVDVLFAECKEVPKSLFLLVVVNSLLQVKDGIHGHWAFLALLDLAHPDSFSLRPSVLLEDTHSGGDGGRECLAEGFDIIVCICVRESARESADFDESILGSHLDHGIGVGHGSEAIGGEGAEHIVELFLGDTLVLSRVDTRNVSICGTELFENCIILGITVEDGFAGPVLFDQSIADGDGVATVSIFSLVAATLAFDDVEGSVWVGRLR